LPKSSYEVRPTSITTESAGVRKGQIFQLQPAPESADLCLGRCNSGWDSVIVLEADAQKYSGELILLQINGSGFRFSP
jgi:hypothetical protein